MTSWKQLLAKKQLIERVELAKNNVTLHFVEKYNKPEHLSHIADAIVYLYSASEAFQAKFKRPQKKSWPQLFLKPNHGYKNATEVLDAFSHFALKKGAIVENEKQASVKALAQFKRERKPQTKPTAKSHKKEIVPTQAKGTVKVQDAPNLTLKTQSEIKSAIAQNTLFKIGINGTNVKLTINREFANPGNYRVINQVLASLQRSSLLLKNNLTQIKNVSRKPRITLKANHGFKNNQALLTALMEAAAIKPTVTAVETITQPVTTKSKGKAKAMPKQAPAKEAMVEQKEIPKQDAPMQEAATLLETVQPLASIASAQNEREEAVVTPELVDEVSIWGEIGSDSFPSIDTREENLLTALEEAWQLPDRLFPFDDEQVLLNPAISEPLPSLLDLGSPQNPPLLYGFRSFLDDEQTPSLFEGIDWNRIQGIDEEKELDEHSSQPYYISLLELK